MVTTQLTIQEAQKQFPRAIEVLIDNEHTLDIDTFTPPRSDEDIIRGWSNVFLFYIKDGVLRFDEICELQIVEGQGQVWKPDDEYWDYE